MIQGIQKFKDYFEDESKNYVIIGGLATALIAEDLGFIARATKDIDLVVISKNNENFIKKLLSFVKEAQYKTKQKTTDDSQRNLFRFFDSEDKIYPEQLELFAIKMIGQDKIMQEIENMRYLKTFDKPEYYSRLKKEIRELCKTPQMTTSSELVTELDKKIKSSKRYYR